MRKHQSQLEAHAKAQALDQVFYETPIGAKFDDIFNYLQFERTFSMPDLTPWDVHQDEENGQLAQTPQGKYAYALEALEFAYDLVST